MGTMVQHPFKFRKSHKLRNYGFFDVRGLFTEDWRQLFISVGAPNVKSPLKRSAVSAQISAGSRFRKSLLHGRLTKILYAAIFTRRYDFDSPPDEKIQRSPRQHPGARVLSFCHQAPSADAHGYNTPEILSQHTGAGPPMSKQSDSNTPFWRSL